MLATKAENFLSQEKNFMWKIHRKTCNEMVTVLGTEWYFQCGKYCTLQDRGPLDCSKRKKSRPVYIQKVTRYSSMWVWKMDRSDYFIGQRGKKIRDANIHY